MVARADRPAAGTTILQLSGLTKRFGQLTAVDGLNLDVRAGEVHGFLGPNGSGKSTTVGMILGLIAPAAGSITILGRDPRRSRDLLRRHVGAIIETPAFYPYLSGRDNLRALALAAGGVPAASIDQLLETVGLTARSASRYKTYSLGMKQRLGIASTLLTEPDLVILDEPTNGLDPAGQHEIRELIPRLAREGRAVLLASHQLHEVEQVCDRVTIIRAGRVVRQGPVSELLRRGGMLDLQISPAEQAAEVARALPWVEAVTVRDGWIAVAAPVERGADLSRALAERGLYPSALIPRRATLENVFLELTGGAAPVEGGRHDGSAP